jgi:hypothetical protein
MVLQESGVESASQHLENSEINWYGIALQSESFILKGMRSNSSEKAIPVAIKASLKLIDGQTLGIKPVQMEGFSEVIQDLREFAVDLGNDVTIEEFSLVESQLLCCGRLTIYN